MESFSWQAFAISAVTGFASSWVVAMAWCWYQDRRDKKEMDEAWEKVRQRQEVRFSTSPTLVSPDRGPAVQSGVITAEERRRPKIITEEREAMIEARAAKEAQRRDPIFP